MTDKVIWITGASSGIGKALAIKFAKEGWKVAISARRENLLNEISKSHDGIFPYPLDVTDSEKCKLVFNDIKTAIRKAGTNKEVFIIGGGEIYKEGLNYADKLYITEVENDVVGDTYFPELSGNWIEVKSEQKEGFKFVDYIYGRN